MKKPKEKESEKVYDAVYVVYLDIVKRLAEFNVQKKSIFIGIKCSERLGLRYYCSFWAYGYNFRLDCNNALPMLSDEIYGYMNTWFPISENGERKMDKQYFPDEE
tara:strand:- start:447 stop:761 length:315 start_codon:yes stop_codon:yes gene_type:complete